MSTGMYGKGEDNEETDTSNTSDSLTSERGHCREGGDYGIGGRDRESATTFAAPGVWRTSQVNSEM